MSESRERHPSRRGTPLTMREAASAVARRLHDAGFSAVFAGGCVRDMLMGREPTDYDVATSARPEDVAALFSRTQQVGAKFGVVLVKQGRHVIEVATFRTDMEYEDGRRPVGVQYSSPEEDARRRDFTINGMFLDPIEDRVIDYVGGREDIEARRIRAIGDPDRRFAEDHLRLIRAVRFAASLDFEIEPATFEAMRLHAPQIARIAPERIRMELERILQHPNRGRAVGLLLDSGLMPYLWPGADRLVPHITSALPVIAALPARASFETGLAAMLLDAPREDAVAACDALRCSNQTRAAIDWILRHANVADELASLSLAQLKRLLAAASYRDWLDLFEARCRARLGSMEPLASLKQRAAAIPPDAVRPAPLLTGYDLGDMGVPAGPIFKRVLEHVYEAQLNEEIRTREQALAAARDLLARSGSQ